MIVGNVSKCSSPDTSSKVHRILLAVYDEPRRSTVASAWAQGQAVADSNHEAIPIRQSFRNSKEKRGGPSWKGPPRFGVGDSGVRPL